jgi:hypothetical protein
MAPNEWEDTLFISELFTLLFFVIVVIGSLVSISGGIIDGIPRGILGIAWYGAPAASIFSLIIYPKAKVQKRIGISLVIQTVSIVFFESLAFALSIRYG